MVVTALTVSVFLAVACGGESDEPEEFLSVGRALRVNVTAPELLDRIVIGDPCATDRHRLLEVTNPNRTFAAVRVRVSNFTSGFIPLFVEPDSAQLGDPRADRIFALDVCKAGIPYDPPEGASEVTHSPMLWGKVELNRNFEIQGWMFFDIPRDLNIEAFWWHDPEIQTVDYLFGKR